MHPIGVASAAWVFATAPSKAPFYVVGALLACWAVLLAVFGISHVGWPSSAAGMRAVMGVSALLVAGTLATAVITAGEESTGEGGTATAKPAPTGKPAAGASGVLALAAATNGTLAYDKKTATVASGTVAIRFVNRAPIPHNVTIARGSQVVAKTQTVTGASASASARLAPGQYVFYCSVDSHRQAGMQGTLTVR